MRKLLARLAGKHRPRTIAIFGTTPAEVECAILHARTGAPDLPIQAWCAEEIKPGCVTRLIERECARFSSGRPALSALNDLHGAWPALTLVAWTGKRGSFAFKLLPFLLPPFRVVVFNEAGGFFAARPASIAKHAKWRLNVACRTKSQLAADWLGGALQWIGSFAFRTGERLVDVINLTRSFFWRAGERIADGFNWAWESFLAVLSVPAQDGAGLARGGRARAPSRARRHRFRIVGE